MRQKILLLCIIIVGFGLRLWQVDKLPAILNRDEAALAYNAYLLRETGQDEWGKTWPLTLESFGDFKLPGYPVILVVLFNFFPRNEWMVRLPSVIAGTILIWLAYLWGQKFYINRENSLFSALFIALTPIFFFYSRIAFEANVALTLIVGALFFLFFAKRNWKSDFIGILLYMGAILTYNTPYLLLPLVIILLILHRGVKEWRKWVVPSLGLIVIFAIFSLIFIPLTGQKKGITIFNDETTWNNYIQYRASLNSPILQKTFGNRWVYNMGLISSRLSNSFSWEFMVSKGGSHPWHVLPGKGHIYIINYLLGWAGLIVAGLVIWQFSRTKNKAKLILKSVSVDFVLTALLFISLLPSIVTVDSPHATRSLLFFYLFIILGIKNLEIVSEHIKTTFNIKHLSQFIMIIIFLTITGESFFYLKQYFISYPSHQPESLKVGLKEAVTEVEQKYSNQKIAYVDGQGYDYILVAWYANVSAHDFFQTINKQLPDKIGFRYGDRLTHYHFIADHKDRVETEPVLVEWDGLKWSIKQF